MEEGQFFQTFSEGSCWQLEKRVFDVFPLRQHSVAAWKKTTTVDDKEDEAEGKRLRKILSKIIFRVTLR